MSLQNITAMLPLGNTGMVLVTFALKKGGTAVYLYTADQGARIEDGEDPKNMNGKKQEG
jgi:hypothetical protein